MSLDQQCGGLNESLTASYHLSLDNTSIPGNSSVSAVESGYPTSSINMTGGGKKKVRGQPNKKQMEELKKCTNKCKGYKDKNPEKAFKEFKKFWDKIKKSKSFKSLHIDPKRLNDKILRDLFNKSPGTPKCLFECFLKSSFFKNLPNEKKKEVKKMYGDEQFWAMMVSMIIMNKGNLKQNLKQSPQFNILSISGGARTEKRTRARTRKNRSNKRSNKRTRRNTRSKRNNNRSNRKSNNRSKKRTRRNTPRKRTRTSRVQRIMRRNRIAKRMDIRRLRSDYD